MIPTLSRPDASILHKTDELLHRFQENFMLFTLLEDFQELEGNIKLLGGRVIRTPTHLETVINRCNDIIARGALVEKAWNPCLHPLFVDMTPSTQPEFLGLPRGAEYELSRFYEMVFTRAFMDLAYALPTPEAISLIKHVLNEAKLTGGLIEIGPGKGLWGRIFQNLGIGYQGHFVQEEMDKYPPFHSDLYLDRGVFYHSPGDLSYLERDDICTHALFLCWPPLETPVGTIHHNDIAFQATQKFLAAAHKKNKTAYVVYVGELDSRACTGGPRFATLLYREFEEVARAKIHSSNRETIDACYIFKSRKASDIAFAFKELTKYEESLPKDLATLDLVSALNTELLSGRKHARKQMTRLSKPLLEGLRNQKLKRQAKFYFSKLKYLRQPVWPKLQAGKGARK